MALFNWVSKGFSTERRAAAEKQEATTAVAVEAKPEPAPVTPQEHASAVLFNYQIPQQYQTQQPTQQGFNSAFAGGTIGNRHILIITPRNNDEVMNIVEHLKTNEAVIVNFEGIAVEQTQRRIDFLSGVACGLGGTISPLDANKYIMTPSGIGIKR